MLLDILFVSVAVSGVAMIVRRLLSDHESLKGWMRRTLPKIVFEGIDCPFCFGFWLSLIAVLVADPLHGWAPQFRFGVPGSIAAVFQLGISWMVIGVAVLTLRTFTEQVFRITSQVACILKNDPRHRHEK
jgi:hypothetical protein